MRTMPKNILIPFFVDSQQSKESKPIKEALRLPPNKSGTIEHVSGLKFTSTVSQTSHVYMISRNISTRFADVPIDTVFPNLNPAATTLTLDAKVQRGEMVVIRAYVIFYNKSERLKTSGFELTEDFNTFYVDVPEDTKRVAFALRVSGPGLFEIETLNFKYVPVHKEKLPSRKDAGVNTTKTEHTKTKALSEKKMLADTIGLAPMLRKVIESGDPFMSLAIMKAVAKKPECRVSFNDTLIYLLRNNNEYAVLDILDFIGEEFGARRHRMRMDALTRLLRMSEVVEYFESLPPNFQGSPQELRFYLRALVWDDQIDKMKSKIKAQIYQPAPNGSLIDILVYASEVLSDTDIATIVEIIINKNIRRITYTHIIYLFDLLNERGMGDTSQRLSKVISDLNKTATRPEVINRLLLSSNVAFRAGDYILQEKFLNEAIERSGLLSVSRIDDSKPIGADNIQVIRDMAYTERLNHNGPLVTVLMTTWLSGETLGYAVQSILDQTYRNLELIIIDDASLDNTSEIIAKIAKTDPRIKPIYLKKNGGTYVAKNHGLKIAKGRYILCQDSDDWAHPEKVQKLVTTLQNSPEAVGVENGHIRISTQNGIQRKTGGYLRRDASSLTYEKNKVSETLGFYDSVRAGADGEFKFRMERVYGRDSVIFLRELLSIVAWESDSLSGKGSAYEISNIGVFAPARLEYRLSFQEYHEKAYFEYGKPSVYTPQMIEKRKFVVPSKILPDRD